VIKIVTKEWMINHPIKAKKMIENMVKSRKKSYREGKFIHHFKGKHFSENHRKKLSESHKGQIPWNKGLTKENSKLMQCISEKLKGRKRPTPKSAWKKGHIPWNKGKMLSEEIKNKLRLSHIGKKPSRESNLKRSLSLKGRKRPKEIVEKIKRTRNTPEIKERLRRHRLKQIFPTKDTEIEVMFQNELRRRDIEFISHLPIENVCQTDMFIEPNMCVFCDGDWWHANPVKYSENLHEIQKNNIEKDKRQNNLLEIMGYKVLRFWEDEIRKNVVKCVDDVEKIREEI